MVGKRVYAQYHPLDAFAPATERRMIMDEVKYYPARMDYPNLCKPYSNADRIRSMSDEELAELLLDGCRGSKCDDCPQNKWGSVNCFQCRVTWLQMPAEVSK